MRPFLRISDTCVVVKLTLGLTGIVSGTNDVERRNHCRFNTRNLKIGRWDEIGRLPEVNLHNWAYARELLPRVFAVVVSSRTPFREFCRRVENVSIFILF